MKLIKDVKDYLKNNNLGCYILSKSPLILISFWYDFYKNQQRLGQKLPKDEPVWFFFSIGNYKSEELARGVKKQIDEVSAIYPNYHFWFMNNSAEEDENFKKAGLNSIFANHNTFLDESRLRVMHKKKKYDAIYLARFTPVKRHYLAKDIKKLFLIGSYKPSEEDYYRESLQILDHATHKEKVLGLFVTNYMNMAHVGLALSDLEGAMYASSEYLLSGIPVVSTPSLGGRDAFYKEPYVKIVEPDPAAVAEAVYEFIKHPPDPYFIRKETIKIMEQQRQDLIDVVQGIYKSVGKDVDFTEEWKRVFVNKLGLRTRIPYNIFRKRILREDLNLTR